MKKAPALFSFILALMITLSSLILPISALGIKIEQEPNQTTFYQGVDWMYSKNGEIILMSGDLNLEGTVLSYNKNSVEYKTGVTGPNMYAKPAADKWQVGKNTVNIYCDKFGSLSVSLTVNFVKVKSISIVRAPKTKLVVGTDWSMGINGDVEMTKYDLTGTILTATYTDSATKSISYPNACLDWSIPENVDTIMPGNSTIYITFCGQKTPLTVSFITKTSFSKGDVSLDGQINSYDALNILQYSTGMITLGSVQISVADVDGNGKINSADALSVLQYVVGIKKSL